MEPFLCNFFEHFISAVHKEGIGCSVRAAHTATKLVKLRKSHLVCIVDNHGIGIGNIQPCLNNSSGYQYVNIPVNKAIHDLLQLVLPHLPMGKGHISFRYQFCHPVGDLVNVIHPIVYIIHLTASGQLPGYRLPDQFFIVFHNKCLDRHSIHRCFFQYAHVPDTDQAHVKGSGNRCGSQCENVYIFL